MTLFAVSVGGSISRFKPPTTDGREIRLRRITEPTAEQKSLLQQLRLSLPDLVWNSTDSVDSATA
jgi:hypothetical protein